MIKFKRAVAMLLAIAMLSSIVGCGKTDEELKEDLTPSSVETQNPKPKAEAEKKEPEKQKEPEKTLEELAAEENEKVYEGSKGKIEADKGAQPKKAVAYISIPGTSIDDWVMWAADNNYFLRKDNSENYSFSGCYYLDQECRVKTLSKNVVIYGHNLSDKPDDVKFASLMHYTTLDFIKANQNIFLKTPEGVQTYKIVAAFYSDINWDYIKANPSEAEMGNILNEYKARSEFQTNAPMTASDKYITLSTCTYKYGKREDQRWVVVGRNMRPNETVDTVYDFTVNPAPKAPEFDKKKAVEYAAEATTEGYKPPSPDAYKDVE